MTPNSRPPSTPLTLAASLILFLAIALPASALNYSFSSLIDSTGMFANFYTPAINNNGTVAFGATYDIGPGSYGLFTADGANLTTITDVNHPTHHFWGTSFPSINDNATVAFLGIGPGGSGIFTSNGGSIATIADESGPLSSFAFSPSINIAGTVTFLANIDSGGSGVFSVADSVTTTIADSNGPFATFTAPTIDAAPIDSNGNVVFFAQSDNNIRGIYSGNGGPATPILEATSPASFFAPNTSDDGTVVFLVGNVSGNSGVVVSHDGINEIVSPSPWPFSSLDPSSICINNNRTVVLNASISGLDGIYSFVGPNYVLHHVIGVGDPLFGSTLTSVEFRRRGLNNAEQIAFAYQLANGIQGIAVAHPYEPGDTDGDLDVDFDDFLAVNNFFGDPGPSSPGDADADGDTDFDDFLAVQNFFGTAPPGLTPDSASNSTLPGVPEPSTISILALATITLLSRRRLTN